MRYFKMLDGEYIIAVGTSNDETVEYDHEITKEEYDTVRAVVSTIPKNPPEGYRYRLDDVTKKYVLVEVVV